MQLGRTRSVLNLLVWLAVVACPIVGRAETRVGVAESDITPPTGFPMAGYYYERLAAGTHDPLKAKAIVFVGDNNQAAIVVCDLTGISTDLTAEVRRRAAEKTGIPAANIVVSATHSHTAPDYGKDLYDYLGGKAPANKPRYSETLINRIVDAIDKAKQAVGPVSLFAGSATQTTPISFNRRFLMRDGSIRTWANFKNPDVVRAAGPIDPEVGLLLVRSAKDEKPLGLFSNFALHLDTVGGLYWSGDYPYYVEQDLRKSLGERPRFDLRQRDLRRHQSQRSESSTRNKTDFIGHSLAATIEAGLSTLHPLDKPVLRVERTTVRLPLPEISPGRRQAFGTTAQGGEGGAESRFLRACDGLQDRDARRICGTGPPTATPRTISSGVCRTVWPASATSFPLTCTRSAWERTWRSSACRARCLSIWAWRSSTVRPSARR